MRVKLFCNKIKEILESSINLWLEEMEEKAIKDNKIFVVYNMLQTESNQGTVSVWYEFKAL